MDNSQKFIVAVRTLKSDVEFITNEDITSQTTFNTVSWVTGTDENGSAITTTTCPHSEITWTKVKEEIDKL
mgnify:FL=1|tara:strand:+ start:635 stop:847 length:213 start_codon:yes stop_codon:yes gene_type:complete